MFYQVMTVQNFIYRMMLESICMGGWDMGIFFPDCTHICVSGARHFSQKTELQESALDFIARLMVAPIPKIAIENPVGVISTRIRKPDQIIQPWQFGHEESKRTCLWLKNLPKLKPTKIMEKRNRNLTPSGQNKLGPSKDRSYLRAKTYLGIAKAMTTQWTDEYIVKLKKQENSN